MRADIQRYVVLVMILAFLPTSVAFANNAVKAHKHGNQETDETQYKGRDKVKHDGDSAGAVNQGKPVLDRQGSKAKQKDPEAVYPDKSTNQAKHHEKKELQDRKELYA
jgi:hypothetical protein